MLGVVLALIALQFWIGIMWLRAVERREFAWWFYAMAAEERQKLRVPDPRGIALVALIGLILVCREQR